MPEFTKTFCSAPRVRPVILAALSAGLLISAPVLADADAALPPGPKQTLALWAGEDAAALTVLLTEARGAEAWRSEFSGIGDESALTALADYLELNLPVEAVGADVQTLVASLPLDGKEIFLATCLSCHGGDRYFLQQDMAVDGWMGIFDAPYHRRLLTEGVERETFASYAAATTPLALDPVPDELQDEQ